MERCKVHLDNVYVTKCIETAYLTSLYPYRVNLHYCHISKAQNPAVLFAVIATRFLMSRKRLEQLKYMHFDTDNMVLITSIVI